jgi:hypothetical protein
MSEGLSQRVREFLLAYVDSIGLLEVLLMLAAAPQTGFTADQVSDHLRTSPMSAQERLRSLTDRKLADRLPNGSFRFGSGAELAAVVREVSEAYRDRRVSVMTLIYSRPSRAVPGVTDP